jgi:tRNA (guanine37-N1)-methyltransferase
MDDIYFVSIHPKFIESYFSFGVFKSILDKQVLKLHSINLRDYAVDKHGSVDSRPYGGGDGMVLRPEPLANAVSAIPNDPYVILTSPRGKIWEQTDAHRFLNMKRPLVFICGRFGGVDERFISNYVDEEISIGNVILSGGELPALLMVDSLLRLMPGALGHEESAEKDSFCESLQGRLEHPLYSKPAVFENQEPPPVLLSGNHKAIEEWRKQESERLTKKFRPDLL